jgi:hypothetical protein
MQTHFPVTAHTLKLLDYYALDVSDHLYNLMQQGPVANAWYRGTIRTVSKYCQHIAGTLANAAQQDSQPHIDV